MNLSAPFIRRPVATTLLSLGLVVAGVIAFFKLPVALHVLHEVDAGRVKL